jgi:hypothetical protein
MKKNRIKRSLLVLFFSFLAIGAQAQLEQAVKKIFAGDTIAGTHTALMRDSDSAYVENLQRTLEAQ